jgi:tetratricopeptide (TPR) repeat protein
MIGVTAISLGFFLLKASPARADTPKARIPETAQATIDRPDNAAADSNPSNPSGKPDYQALLSSMSKADFATRRSITYQLWMDREHSREVIQAATRDTDPEIAGRAQWILKQWQKGILPGVPPKVTGLLKLSQEIYEPIGMLLEMGEFRTLAISLSESDGATGKTEIRELTSRYLQAYFPVYVTRAAANNTLSDLWGLVDQVANTEELCLTRIEMMSRLNIKVDNDNLLPSSSATWEANKIQKYKVMLWAALENVQEARKAAGNNVELQHQLAIVTRDVETLTQVESIDTAREAAIAIIASDWIEDEPTRSERFRAIMNLPILKTELTPSENLMLLHAMGSVGEMNGVEKRLSQVNVVARSTYLASANRYQAAMDALSLDSSDVCESIEKEVDQLLAAGDDVGSPDEKPKNNRRDRAPDVVPPGERSPDQSQDKFPLAMQWMKIQFQVGNDLGGWQLADRVWQTLARAEPTPSNLELFAMFRSDLLNAISESEHKNKVIRMLTGKDQGIAAEDFELLIPLMSDCDKASFIAILGGVTHILNELSLTDRALATMDLFEGRIPQGFDPDKDFKRLVESLRAPTRRERLAGTQLKGDSSLIIVRLLQRHQQYDLAEKFLEQMLSEGDYLANLQLADRYLRSGSADSALQQFQYVINADSPLTHISLADWIRAVVGEAVALDRLGVDDLSRKSWEQVDWVSLSPDPDVRIELANELAETDHQQTILTSLYRVAVVSCFDTQSTNSEPLRLYLIADAFDTLRKSDAISAEQKSVACMNAAWWYPLAIDAVDHQAFQIKWLLGFSYRSAAARLESAILLQDEGLASRTIDHLLAIQPLDILFAENTVPKLKEAGWEELAVKSLDRVLENGQTHLDAFPLDAGVSNNLAWVAAKSDRSLSSALKWSRFAVDRFPDSTIYRDTLAEVLFHLDRRAEALRIEQDCLLDDPGQWHLHEQIERFQVEED